jgi:hypothetical protein
VELILIYSHDHPLAHSTVNKISDLGNDSYHAIELTLTIAQKGHLLATNVPAFCDAITKKHNSLEHLEGLLLKLNTIADKGYGRSVEARGRLICIRAGISQVGFISFQCQLYQVPYPFRCK